MFRLLLHRNGWTDCVKILYEIGVPLVAVHAIVMDTASLHVRTWTPRFCISGTAWLIVFKFGVWVGGHYVLSTHWRIQSPFFFGGGGQLGEGSQCVPCCGTPKTKNTTDLAQFLWTLIHFRKKLPTRGTGQHTVSARFWDSEENCKILYLKKRKKIDFLATPLTCNTPIVKKFSNGKALTNSRRSTVWGGGGQTGHFGSIGSALNAPLDPPVSPQAMGGAFLHVHNCTRRFCVSGITRPIVFKFGVWVGGHQLRAFHKSWVGCICMCARVYPFFMS